MSEARRSMKLLLAIGLCAAMVMSMMAVVPHEAAAGPEDGWIQGRVLDGVTPIPNSFVIYMMYTMGGGTPLGSDWTDSSGTYNFTVMGGFDYMIMAFNGSYFAGNGTTTVLPGQQSDLNILLAPIAPLVADVTLHGWVKDAGGNPVTVGNIIGIANDPSNMGQGPPYYGNSTTPDGITGEYSVNIIASAVGGGVAIMDVPGFPMIENSTTDPLVSGASYWFNLTVEMPLSTNDAVVQGNVTDFLGNPLENVLVYFESSNNWTRDRGYSNYTFTDAAGKYLMNVTNGTFSISFSKSGFATYRLSEQEIVSGDSLWIDGALIPTDAKIRGNVTTSSLAPLSNARVFLFDNSMENISYAITNSTGEYTLNAFNGTDLYLRAEADGYGSNWTYVNISAGDVIWHDFVLAPLDALMHGKVTDKLSGLPIANAGVWVHSSVYDDYKNTNGTGDYSMGLLSGVTYTVDVSATGYRHNTSQISIVPGDNVYDVQMLPSILPQTTLLYGWANDSGNLSGIGGAQVQVGLVPPEYGEQNNSLTNDTGYYEMWIPPIKLMYVVTARGHLHAQGTIDATGQAQVRLDVLLGPDNWSPNVTFSQSPTLNISWTNPSLLHAVIQDQDPARFMMINALCNNTSGDISYFVVVQMLADSFNPLDYGSNDLPFVQSGDNYTVDYSWNGTATGGWLSGSAGSRYLGSYEMSQGPRVYDGLRGYYTNSTLGGVWMPGTAWFDRPTGDFAWFQFDGSTPWAYPSDASGLFQPSASAMAVNDTSGSMDWLNNWTAGNWSVVGLDFVYNTMLPSGRYLSMFYATDFGEQGWARLTNMTVDNAPPIANAGFDQLVAGGESVTFDGTLSSDNVGIENWTWTFEYDGSSYTLYGPVVDFVFFIEGTYNITLTVRDGAGHVATDSMEVTVAGMIPEFPMLVLPVGGILAIMSALGLVRRKREEK